MLAIVRPDSWSLVLLLHVAGAMVLVATLIVSLFAFTAALRRGDQPATRFAFRVLYMGVLPSYVAMRVGAQLSASKEHLDKLSVTWADIGYGVADGGAVLLLVAIVLAGLAYRRARRGTPAGRGGLIAARGLNGLMIAAYVAAIFAMTAKPS